MARDCPLASPLAPRTGRATNMLTQVLPTRVHDFLSIEICRHGVDAIAWDVVGVVYESPISALN